MRSSIPGGSRRAPRLTFARYAAVAAMPFAIGAVAPASGQVTPNWGSESIQTRPNSAAAPSASPWGGTSPAAPVGAGTSTQSGTKAKTRPKAEPLPPALAEILKRPDTDVITLKNGQTRTVREIRAAVNKRRAVLEALRGGELPAGRKRVRLATARSPHHEELLNASKALKDAARREAAAAWAAPGASAEVHPGQRDPAAVWADAGATSQAGRRSRDTLKSQVLGGELHSGLGGTTLPQSGPATLRSNRSASSEVSQKPAQIFAAENAPPGISLVNGRSKSVLFTPGGLYTLIGSGFGDSLGAVDLVGPHLPGGRLALQVTQWAAHKLQAEFPEPLSGVADQPVTLRVTTRDGALLTMDVQFYATRQPLILSKDDGWDVRQVFNLTLGNPNDWDTIGTAAGQVVRTKSGNNIDCPSVGQDLLRTALPPGWALAEVAISSWFPTQSDPNQDAFGDGGNTVVSGSYSIKQDMALTNPLFEVSWGVLRSHSTHGLDLSLIHRFEGTDYPFDKGGNDNCASLYQFEVTLVGPAGLRPF